MKAYTKLALGCLTVILLIILLFGLYSYEGISPLFDAICCLGIIAFLLYLLAIYFAHIKVRCEQQPKQQPQKYQELEDLPTSDTILYLRPFKIDDQVITEIEYNGMYYTSIEPILCQMFKESGTPVAVGNPRKAATTPDGTIQISPSPHWQDNVTQLMEQSSHVILYVDFTEGVKWEIEKAFSGYKHKLILIPALYNTREKLSYTASLASPFGISYILHSLRYHRFLFLKKWLRKRAYYQQWDATFPSFGFPMNDTVSAVIFDGDKAIPFYTEKPNLECQFHAIHRAINEKLGVSTPPQVFIKADEQPLFSLCADMDMDTLPGNIVPFALGQVDFYEEGFRYRSPLLEFMSGFNINMRHHYRKQLKYKKNQLWPYTSIESTRRLDKNVLSVVCEKANGSSKLIFPACHAACCDSLQQFLEQKRTGNFTSALLDPLKNTQRSQEQDYALAILLVEAFGLLAGMLLWAFSFSSPQCGFILAACSPFWHIALVCFCGIFFRKLKGSLLPMILRWLSGCLNISIPEVNASAGKLLLFAMIALHSLVFLLSL